MENYKVIKKILGLIEPVGETYEDSRRNLNLQETIKVMEYLLEDIRSVAKNKDRVEYSMREAGKLADSFLESISWQIENDHHVVEGDNGDNIII